MRQTVIGIFNKYADARHAAQLLQTSGFGDSVSMTDEAAGPPGVHPPEEEGVLDHVRQFFAGLFGSGARHDVGPYVDTVCRGGAVVRVEVEQERDLDTVRDALQNAGAIDIKQRDDAADGAMQSAQPLPGEGTPMERRAPDKSAGLRSFSHYDADFRDDFETWYGGTGSLYDDYEPAYRYGHFLANDRDYAGRRWEDFEPDARRAWERRHPQRAWQRVKTAIRHAWERAMS